MYSNPQQNVNTSFFLSTSGSSVSSVVRSQKEDLLFLIPSYPDSDSITKRPMPDLSFYYLIFLS